MPLWKVYHPVGAFTAEDKKKLAKQVTEVYARIPIPKFYVVFIYEEMAKDSCFVGGEPNNKFVRFKIDHIARTLPGQSSENGGSGPSIRSSLPTSRTRDMIGRFPLMKPRSICGLSKGNLPRLLNLSLRSDG